MYQIIDKFLDEEEANLIENLLFFSNFPWYYQSKTVDSSNKIYSKCYISWPGLRHFFYYNDSISSKDTLVVLPIFNEFKKLVNNINLKSMAANLNMPVISNETLHGLPHVDQESVNPNLTGIYYVNDCDGDTILFKEKFDGNRLLDYNLDIKTKIQPRKNRFVYWDSRAYHAAPICNTIPRAVIVLNVAVV